MSICVFLQNLLDAVAETGAPDGAEVTFPPGAYQDRVVVRSSVRIIGHGATLSGDDEGSLVRIRSTASDVTIEGLELQGGRAIEGAGVRVGHDAAVTLRECTLRGCTASALGGGIYVCKGRVSLAGCTVMGCRAAHGGGIAAVEAARVELARVRLLSNVAVRGAAITVWDRAALSAADCELQGNRADLSGAALWVRGSAGIRPHVVLSSCTFGPADDLDFGHRAGGPSS